MADDGVEDRLGDGGRGHAPIVTEELPDLLPLDRARPHIVHRVVLLALALVFTVCGIIGWLIPLIPGFPFYLLALACAGLASRRVSAWINRHERRLPRGFRVMLRPRMLLRRKRSAGQRPAD